MLRFKHFSGPGESLEDSVNEWLEEFEPDITQMAQTVGPDGILNISIVFEESFRGQERRLSSESGMDAATRPSIPMVDMRDEPLRVSIDDAAPTGEQP